MRNEPPFRCVRCGDEHAAGHQCTRCRAALTDAEGREIAAPRSRRYRVPSRAGIVARVMVLLLAAFGAAALIGNLDHYAHGGFLFGAIAVAGLLTSAFIAARQLWGPRWLDRRRAKSTARHLRAFGPPIAIESAKGRARVRGRVCVLAPVRFGRIEAAVGQLRALAERHGDPQASRQPLEPYMEQHARCGRFLVDDGTHIALVDEDAFEIGLRRGQLPVWQGSLLAVRDGDEVEVAGPCRREPVSDPELRERLLRDGYRQATAEILTFDGAADDRVIILCDQAEQPQPLPRTGGEP